MNTKQIVEKHKGLLDEYREYEKALEAVEDEIGHSSKPYQLMKKLLDEKREELRKFSLIEWYTED